MMISIMRAICHEEFYGRRTLQAQSTMAPFLKGSYGDLIADTYRRLDEILVEMR